MDLVVAAQRGDDVASGSAVDHVGPVGAHDRGLAAVAERPGTGLQPTAGDPRTDPQRTGSGRRRRLSQHDAASEPGARFDARSAQIGPELAALRARSGRCARQCRAIATLPVRGDAL